LGTYQDKIAKQLVVARDIAQRRRKARDARRRVIVASMLERIASGSSRNKAIARARAEGASLQVIGTAVGLSRERVRQIVAGIKHKGTSANSGALADRRWQHNARSTARPQM
jgi:DNA-directed RNA polymerase sigma subunit (sigma70/sigma32)